MTTGATTNPIHSAKQDVSPVVWRERIVPGREVGSLFIASLSAATLTLARAPTESSLLALNVILGISLTFPWIIWWGLRTSWRQRLENLLPILALTWVSLPFLLDLAVRQISYGTPLEILMLMSVQNGALICGAYSHHRRCQQVSSLFASFLLLFSLVLSNDAIVWGLAAMTGVAVLWWMMARYWERVQRTRVAARTDRLLPLRWSVLVVVAAISLLLLAILGTSPAATYALQGFFPSSGGSGEGDPSARSGVGDGDALVGATDQAMSFGPVETDLFLDSNMPSLYDLFSEIYGEPLAAKKTERSVAVSADDVQFKNDRIAMNKQSGREFSTIRRQNKPAPRQLNDRDSAAMLYVVGRVPLHLALQRFDTFDGRTWTHSGKNGGARRINLQTVGQRPWMSIAKVSHSIAVGESPHALKIINLKTNRIPSPPQLTRISIDKVDDSNFFGWSDDGVICMPVREHLPQLTVIQLRSADVNLATLREHDFSQELLRSPSEEVARCLGLSPEADLPDDERIASTGIRWTTGVPRGWQQVEAVVRQLRSNYEHDPTATLPEDCQNSVAYFLQEKRGPDYLFASTAAVILRELGYPTRVVGGLYARPERYSRTAEQTSVLAEDAHFWVEVCVDNATWIGVEPTPGYEPPVEQLTWKQKFAAAVASAAGWVWRNAAAIGLLACGLWAIFLARVRLCDWVLSQVYWLLGSGSMPGRVKATLQLLEWRAWLAGVPRPKSITVRHWYVDRAIDHAGEAGDSLTAFIQWVDKTLYAPNSLQGGDSETVAEICATAIRSIGVRTMKDITSLHRPTHRPIHNTRSS